MSKRQTVQSRRRARVNGASNVTAAALQNRATMSAASPRKMKRQLQQQNGTNNSNAKPNR
jgi:hypothetical protein